MAETLRAGHHADGAALGGSMLWGLVNGQGGAKMKKKVPFALMCLLIMTILVACAPTPPSQSDFQIMGVASPISLATTDVNWYLLPGGDMSSLHISTYYVEIEVANTGRNNIDVPGVEAYFYGEDSDILLIRAVQPGELEPGDEATFHLDTDGYTNWLLMSLETDAPVTLCISLVSEGEVVASFATMLPSDAEFRKQRSLTLSFSETNSVPNVDELEPAKAEEWPRGVPGLGPPAVIREQGDETAIYFYYRQPEAQR